MASFLEITFSDFISHKKAPCNSWWCSGWLDTLQSAFQEQFAEHKVYILAADVKSRLLCEYMSWQVKIKRRQLFILSQKHNSGHLCWWQQLSTCSTLQLCTSCLALKCQGRPSSECKCVLPLQSSLSCCWHWLTVFIISGSPLWSEDCYNELYTFEIFRIKMKQLHPETYNNAEKTEIGL